LPPGTPPSPPFYFLKAGLYVSLPAVWAGLGLILALLALKLVTKLVGVWPLARAFGLPPQESSYTALLMSTGLTFGTISALFGLTNGVINQEQYTILVTVVILSAVVPTLIAKAFFQPRLVELAAPAASELVGAIGGEVG
jgi:Kef-type K+ transport system membrane component KefB